MSLARDDVYEVLSNRRRRFVIHYLQRNGPRAALGTLAEHVAAWEDGIDVEAVGSAARKNVYTSLQQFHLPKMEKLDLVIFHQRDGEVELTDVAADVDLYLEVVEGHDVPWSLYYLGVGALAGGVMLGHALDLPLLVGLGDVDLAVFTVIAIATMALIHTYYTRGMRLGTDGPPPEVER
ncbi:DUF7344 domain-containing protein [Haloplanus rubicundus]|uniref:DUF7344 domain-containing protein n=1 Tax=Haloplanus rubicundus TaxID=1547898 RepID=A0A345EES1_9EURY|nr:hypothetical protein [Haloplanus rubicundus]AXG10693.1 hypothetical protein DU484_13040 [Haloplanus rubicundus]